MFKRFKSGPLSPPRASALFKKRSGALWLLAAWLLPTLPLAAGTVGVNGSTTYQTIDGFGAATVWNGISTAQAPVLWTDDSAATVANTTAHVNGNAGFSIVRTRIDPNEEANGTGTWNGELNQVVLARKTNPSITSYATAWTPPPADKQNNSTTEVGNNDPTNCFAGLPTTNNGAAGRASADTDYANYLVKYAQYANSYLTSQGAAGNLDIVSVQNEPDWNTTYESALWTGPQFDTFVGSYLGPAVKTAGLPTKIMITESFHDSLALASNTMNDANAAPYVSYIGGHLYGATNPPPTLASAGWSHLTNQRYWETEISDGSGTAFNATSMTYGLEEAGWIHPCIVDASMNAYNHWWINNSGVDAFYYNGQWARAFYVEGNYSKFIRPGFVRIGATEFPEGGSSTTNSTVWCSAYKSATGSRVVIVAVNHDTNSHTETFNLSGLGTCTQVAPWLTDSSNGLVQQPLTTVSGGSFSYTLPAQSVISFVGDCGNPPSPTPSATITRTATASPTLTPSPTASRTPSPIPTAGPCQYIAAVACGSTAAYTSAHLGLTFGADQQYTPGSAPGAAGSYGYVSWAAGTAYASTATIIGGDAVDAALYNNQRYATTLGYDFSVPNGQAYVTLYWAETYATAPGQRVMSLTINGSTVAANLDLYVVAGANATYISIFPVTVTNGVLSLVATASVNNAEFQGISVQAGPPCTPSPTLSPTWTTSPTRTATPSASATATASPTATRTDSPTTTRTASATATPSGSPSATALSTATPTQSPSALASATDTPTPHPSASVTSSPSASASPSSQPTATVTPMDTATASSTVTASGTVSPAETATATATPTLASSASPSPTVTPTATVTTSATPTITASATATASATVTTTATGTITITARPSASATPTATPSLTPIPTASATPQPAAGIVSPSPLEGPSTGGFPVSVSVTGVTSNTLYVEFTGTTVTATLAATVSSGAAGVTLLGVTLPTLTATEAASATRVTLYIVTSGGARLWVGSIPLKFPTLTPSPVIDNGPVVIRGVWGVPNPNPDSFAVDLDGRADGMDFKVFTKGLVLAEGFQAGPLPQGWSKVPLPPTLQRLPNGLYYLLVQAHRGPTASPAVFAKLMILQ